MKSIVMIHKLLQELMLINLVATVSAYQDSPSGGIVNGQPVGKCVAGFCLPLKYSSLDPPLIVDENNNTLPNNVNITTDIMDILVVSLSIMLFDYLRQLSKRSVMFLKFIVKINFKVNDKEFSITVTMYFTVIWEDPRLVTNMTVEEGTFTPIDLNFLNHMWVPNIFIYDLRFFKSLNVLKKLAGVFIVGTDKVYYNQVNSKNKCNLK